MYEGQGPGYTYEKGCSHGPTERSQMRGEASFGPSVGMTRSRGWAHDPGVRP